MMLWIALQFIGRRGAEHVIDNGRENEADVYVDQNTIIETLKILL